MGWRSRVFGRATESATLESVSGSRNASRRGVDRRLAAREDELSYGLASLGGSVSRMTRRKTYLTPEEQWDRTAAVGEVEFGPPGYYGLVRQKPGYPMYERGPLPSNLFLVQGSGQPPAVPWPGTFSSPLTTLMTCVNPIYGVSSRVSILWTGTGSRLFRSSDPRDIARAAGSGFVGIRVAVEWVDLPGRLVGKVPKRPGRSRSFVTATLRAGASECG